MQLYTQEFYETVVKRKLAPGGVFVTQSGPAGVLSATQVHPSRRTCAERADSILQFTECMGYSRARQFSAAVSLAGVHSDQPHVTVGVPCRRPFPAAPAFLRGLLGEHRFAIVSCTSKHSRRSVAAEHDVMLALLYAIAGVEHGIYRQFAESADGWRG